MPHHHEDHEDRSISIEGEKVDNRLRGRSKRSALLAAGACVLLGLPGCLGGGDEGDDRNRQRAKDYVLALERMTDDLTVDGTTAQDTLIRLRYRSLSARRGAALLAGLARRVKGATVRFPRLVPPDGARDSNDSLERAVRSLSAQLSMAAADVRAADRGRENLRTVALRQGDLVRAYTTGMSDLARAVLALAIESAK